MIAKRTTKTL